ncbi:class I SAM-dependent methyltransferase [Kitasatospora sp. DSM 101779]|uniref:class I SAM-dependent methyltransferase n=1 Tax=Kitasatospora sp. DSM 101779 TaxID=2853165 RepID=UPI0021D85FC4|nr:class I SAM-dependent methyltransferase [Kitasatospora sp. DSM 101779]MCU7823931.1 class I SAM-dependent methyltransferase [Kitasatospora sp. DSM 101779]
MAMTGTDAYRAVGGLPDGVARAVTAARRAGFPYSCRPEQGRLLQVLAGGARLRIGESGTGYGVGLAWLAAGAAPGVELVSVERDPARAAAAAALFADDPRVRVLAADWTELHAHGPYDLLVLDGGGQGKGGGAADPERLLAPGGVLVVDDFTPADGWPPLFDGQPDEARLHWLRHPALRTVDLPLAADLSSIVAVRRHGG